MLYSRVPRSSAWPSIGKVYWPYICSHCACFSGVAHHCGVSPDQFEFKNTRSRPLTTKSCWLPGGAVPTPACAGSFGLLAQPATSVTSSSNPANFAARMTLMTFAIPVPPLLRRYRTCRRSSRCVVKRKLFSTLTECYLDHSNARKSGNPRPWLMADECGALWAPKVPFFRTSLQQRRPSGVGRVARCLEELLVAPGHVHRIERRTAFAAGVAEEHNHAPVRRPGRSFIVIALGQNPLARSVRAHDSDRKPAFGLLGEGDVVAARRPHRRRVGAVAEADALRLAAARGHDVDLLLAAAIGFERDAGAV